MAYEWIPLDAQFRISDERVAFAGENYLSLWSLTLMCKIFEPREKPTSAHGLSRSRLLALRLHGSLGRLRRPCHCLEHLSSFSILRRIPFEGRVLTGLRMCARSVVGCVAGERVIVWDMDSGSEVVSLVQGKSGACFSVHASRHLPLVAVAGGTSLRVWSLHTRQWLASGKGRGVSDPNHRTVRGG